MANKTSKESATRTKRFVMLETPSSDLEAQSWQVKDIKAGLAEAENGDFATESQVYAVFAKYGVE